MLVLAVQVDEPAPPLRQRRRRCEPAVDVRPRAPDRRHDPREDDLVVVEDEATLDDRLVGTGPHQRRVGLAADEQVERLHEHRLARAGLARERGHAVADEQAQVGDDAEVLDDELDQHRGYRSDSPNLAFRMRWKLFEPNRTSRAGRAAAVHSMAWPSVSSPRWRPSADTVAGRWPSTSSRTRASGASTIDRSKSMCGDTGVITMARWAGSTMGPRAENEYAVEPVG